jgi:uncharacterized protein YndB with AHSA1/START domain
LKNSKFIIEREFNAPRDVVFKVWTQPEHLAKWMAPKGFQSEYKKADVKPGGMYHYVMTSPDGAQMWGKVVYKELKFPNRIVYLQYFSDEAGGVTRHPMSSTWPLEMLTTIVFEEPSKGKTKIVLTWEPQDANAVELETFEAAKSGMTQGWGGTFELLENYLKEIG